MKRRRGRLLLMVAALVAVAGCGRGGPAGAGQKKTPVLSIPRNQMTHDGPVSSVAFSPDGKTLASASDDRTIRLWDVATGKERATLKGHSDKVICVAFSPDGKTLASGSLDDTARLWDVATGKERATLKEPPNPSISPGFRSVLSVAFSPDGKTLASASVDKTIRLWDVPAIKQSEK